MLKKTGIVIGILFLVLVLFIIVFIIKNQPVSPENIKNKDIKNTLLKLKQVFVENNLNNISYATPSSNENLKGNIDQLLNLYSAEDIANGFKKVYIERDKNALYFVLSFKKVSGPSWYFRYKFDLVSGNYLFEDVFFMD